MKIAQLNFSGDRNLGIYAKSSDKFCLAGNFVREKDLKILEKVLKVEAVHANVFNTDFASIFSAFNSNGIILPKLIFENELKFFKGLTKKFGMNLAVLKTKYTAVGNLILCNDRGCVISKLFSRADKKVIEDCLDVETESFSIAGLDNVGSCGIATNLGCLVHRDAEESEVENLESVLKVEVDIGTANFGSPFVGSCIVANSNGMLIGDKTTGPEVTRAMEALNLL